MNEQQEKEMHEHLKSFVLMIAKTNPEVRVHFAFGTSKAHNKMLAENETKRNGQQP